jgi:hypothetical protein
LSTHAIAGVLGRLARGTVEVSGSRRVAGVVRVRMGVLFRADIPLEHIRSTSVNRPKLLAGVGVHGWRGSWLVNGRMGDATVLEIDPPVRAWVTGIPVTCHRLSLGVEDPAALATELDPASAA